jgi:hypothetical protein
MIPDASRATNMVYKPDKLEYHGGGQDVKLCGPWDVE